MTARLISYKNVRNFSGVSCSLLLSLTVPQSVRTGVSKSNVMRAQNVNFEK
jgi:hypothetical protein